MVCGECIADWGRLSSDTSLPGRFISRFMTALKHNSVKCLLVHQHLPALLKGKERGAMLQYTLHPTPRATNRSCASIHGRCTSFLQWPQAHLAQSAQIPSGSSRPVFRCASIQNTGLVRLTERTSQSHADTTRGGGPVPQHPRCNPNDLPCRGHIRLLSRALPLAARHHTRRRAIPVVRGLEAVDAGRRTHAAHKRTDSRLLGLGENVRQHRDVSARSRPHAAADAAPSA